MDSSAEHADGDADAHLLRLSRDGDRRAFSELWRRHAPTAVAYARSLGAAPPDPEDVVSDAFVSILQLLRTGKGPVERFRPYLLTTVRNTWLTAARRAPSTVPLESAEDPPSLIGTIDVDAMVNSAALSEAFCALPERWQHALWLSEVEQLPPREIADVLGMRANAVAALTYRARDGLRKAWIGAHLRRAPAGSDHVRVIELLGSYVHGDLGPRPQKLVTAHLTSCADCRAAADEARHLARAITLGPLLVGGAGLVIAPAFFPAQQAAAATLAGASHAPGWLSVPIMLHPAATAVGHAAPVLWPVAASVAVALAVSGSLFVRTPTEPDATGVDTPAVALPPTAAPAAPPAQNPAPTPSTLPGATAPPAAVPPTVLPPSGGAPLPAPPADEAGSPGAVGGGTSGPGDDRPKIPVPVDHGTLTVPIEHEPIDTYARSSPAVDLVVSRLTTPGLESTAKLSVTGPPCGVFVIVVDYQPTGLTVHLDENGHWTGALELPSPVGQYTLSVFHTGAEGQITDLAVQRPAWF
ncbi:sigma-70 family RNA polymerase sigma factor [Microbacterium sp. PMB16]|uniref:sigma-70 family RNA polymerase sigma factor n=1 Tax=Microbacterium sp. PMB16 TaxID=3120157 RepID=UPI003F4BAFD9